MKRGTWVLAAALIAACGRGSTDSAAVGSTGGDDTGTGEGGTIPDAGSDPGPCNGSFTVRLAGADGEVQPLDLAVAGVDLVGSGGPIAPTFVAGGTVSFPVSGAYRMAVAPLPAGGGAVGVTIRFGSVGVTEGGTSTDVDVCSAPISFRVDTSSISPDRCHVVAILDLARSLVAGPGGTVFLPNFTVRY